MPPGRPLKFKTPEEMQVGIDRYFNRCEEKNLPYTIEGLAVCLGVDRWTVLNYEKKDEFSHTIKSAKEKILQHLAERSINGELNSACTIFNMKNNFGYKDKQEHQIDGDITGINIKIVRDGKDV